MNPLIFEVFKYEVTLQCRFIVDAAELLDEAVAMPQDQGACPARGASSPARSDARAFRREGDTDLVCG